MKKINETISGQTPLPPNYREHLIPQHIQFLSELNQYEQVNISKAQQHYLLSRRLKFYPIKVTDLFKLHERMFGDVWTYAGKKRKRETNPGVFPEKIYDELGVLLGDLDYWVSHQTYSIEEIAVRFHYRLVFIHPFEGGNGRHTRLAADLFLKAHGKPPIKWGGDLVGDTPERDRYIECLVDADQGDITSLIQYCLS